MPLKIDAIMRFPIKVARMISTSRPVLTVPSSVR